MALRIMSTILSVEDDNFSGSGGAIRRRGQSNGSSNSEGSSSSSSHQDKALAREREEVQRELLGAAQQVRERFNGRELATEADRCVARLCGALERALGHGLRPAPAPGLVSSALGQLSELVGVGSAGSSGFASSSRPGSLASFWQLARDHLITRHERERFETLRHVRTDAGRARAWIRSGLNERSLERQILGLLALPQSDLLEHYLPGALLLDPQLTEPLPGMAADLATVLFAVRIDLELLDQPEVATTAPPEPVIEAPTLQPPMQPRRQIAARLVRLDDDDDDDEEDDSSSGALATATASNDEVLQARLLTPLADPEHLGSLEPVIPYAESPPTPLPAIEAIEDQVSPPAGFETESNPRIAALAELLEQARDDALASRQQLARLQRQQQNYLDRHELQEQSLRRENELLRQQLRKYVSAVQMLNDRAALGEDDQQQQQQQSRSVLEQCPDYHHESKEYERKLVQVAEMHAELMEFNGRLTRQLGEREHEVRLLRAELECLRGPVEDQDDRILRPLEPACLIHIWIPSVFLTGQPSDLHHVYQIYIRIKSTEWNIYRRYAQFHALNRKLKKIEPVVSTFEFPPKKTIGNKDPRFVEERRQKLQLWLRRIVNRISHCSAAFTAQPVKQTLVMLLPFFGDSPDEPDIKQTRSARNAYSSSPQYMGL
ncbi:sorting nexin-29 isoform X3 [Trichogramma pretiosum]|uniref:sorting nexin-29 isoform X2 n=1 Tax=Trichogramma pretiosum TaxID=7493 RepID=UPI0006C9D292|nr:sorting nexin-29 isoform X2 [Trichogramma pretiosum]XP_023316591.1 sorting nexin-29 isoform X3 [Trichogramma pretiosum]